MKHAGRGGECCWGWCTSEEPTPQTSPPPQALAHFPEEEGGAELLAAFLRWCMAAPHTLRCHLVCSGEQQLTAALKVGGGAMRGLAAAASSGSNMLPTPDRLLPPSQDLLHLQEATWLLERQHRPCAAAAVMSAVLRRAALDPIQRSLLDGQLGELLNVVGGCERLLKTPIPAAYSRCVSGRRLFVLKCTSPCVLFSRRVRTSPCTV